MNQNVRLHIHKKGVSKISVFFLLNEWLLTKKNFAKPWKNFPKQSPKLLLRKSVLKNFAKPQEKPVLKFLYNKVAGTWPATLLKRESNVSVFLWILQIF